MLALLIEATRGHFSFSFIVSITLRLACIGRAIDPMSIYLLNGIYSAPMWPLPTSVRSELLNCIIPNVDLITSHAHPMLQFSNPDKPLLCVNVCIFA